VEADVYVWSYALLVVHARNTHPFNGLLSGTTRVSRYQKGKTDLDLLKQQTVASAGLYASLHLAPDRQPSQHPTTQFFTGWMPFLPTNQQRQSTEDKKRRNRSRLTC